MPKVFIGVGHGGIDSGAIGNGLYEKNLTLSIAMAVCNELIRHDVNVLSSRTTDENDTLREEIDECNAYGPDVAVDVHINSSATGGGDGFEAYYHHGGGLGKTLAENIETEVKAIGQNSRGVKTKVGNNGDYYAFIRETNCPAVIVECAFINNANDIAIIDTESEQVIMGKAIAKGILKTLNIPYKEEHKMRYKDLPETHWAYKAVEYLSEKGIVDGYEDGTFKPYVYVTRAEIAVMIARNDGRYDKDHKYLLSLSDVSPDAWYTNEVNFCIETGLITGYPDGTFRPNAFVTRSEIATILVREMEAK